VFSYGIILRGGGFYYFNKSINMLSFNEYQRAAAETAIYRQSIEKYVYGLGIPDDGKAQELVNLLCTAYVILGLAGEAGEVAGAFKKVLRDGDVMLTEEKKKDLLKETGDTLWYSSQVSAELGENYATTASNNINKLLDRKERGVLSGSGNDR
jgi:NTP pyrophosphatase (non-canonical NTP hydrolase)